MTALCKICGSETTSIGSVQGQYIKREFHFVYCPGCHLRFVENPDTDYVNIYNEAYYTGYGADPYIDYMFELEHPQKTIRQYEWYGILRAVKSLIQLTPQTRWLDFGSGNGGLVRYCTEQGIQNIAGLEEGWIVQKYADHGIKAFSRDNLQTLHGTFDIVTAIEVIEHAESPLETLSEIRQLLRPGGLFFYTTGNAEPFQHRFFSWPYVVPEIHINFFEPQTLERALKMVGFEPQYVGMYPGIEHIIFYKLLKTLHQRQTSPLHRLIPRKLLAHFMDRIFKFSAHPIGWTR